MTAHVNEAVYQHRLPSVALGFSLHPSCLLILPLLPGGRFRALANRKQRPCIAFCVAKRAWRIGCWWSLTTALSRVAATRTLCRGSSLARRRNAILFAFTNKEASYSQVTGGVVGPDKLSARNWLACWRSVSWIIRRMNLRTKPRKGTRQSYQNPPASQAEFHWLRGYVDGC